MRGYRNTIAVVALVAITAAGWALADGLRDRPAVDPTTGTTETLDAFLQREAAEMRAALPVRTDEVTVWETVSAAGRRMTFGYRLEVAVPAADRETLVATIRPQVVRVVCTDAQVRAVLDKGAIVDFVYTDADGAEAARLSMDLASCGE